MVSTIKSRKKARELSGKGEPEPDIQEKFTIMRKDMSESLIERDEEIDCVLTALICQENCLLVGNPGTAKSFLLDSIMEWLGVSAKKFSILFNKFTTPEEVFGPISIQGLKEDKYRRITTNKLPEAHLFFGDEIFKASTAILNTLLRIINEKVYENGDGSFHKVPLLLAVAASNEWPNDQDGGKELGALFDRFLFRKTVRPIASKSGRESLLWIRNHKPALTSIISPEEIKGASNDAKALSFTTDAKEGFMEILEELIKEGIHPGDRRMYKAIDAVKAYAYLNGGVEYDEEDDNHSIEKEHLEILAHVLWNDPAEQPEKCARIVARIANPTGHKITELLMQAQDVISKSKNEDLISKLQAIRKELESLTSTNANGQVLMRIDQAIGYVKNEIRSQMTKVIDG